MKVITLLSLFLLLSFSSTYSMQRSGLLSRFLPKPTSSPFSRITSLNTAPLFVSNCVTASRNSVFMAAEKKRRNGTSFLPLYKKQSVPEVDYEKKLSQETIIQKEGILALKKELEEQQEVNTLLLNYVIESQHQSIKNNIKQSLYSEKLYSKIAMGSFVSTPVFMGLSAFGYVSLEASSISLASFFLFRTMATMNIKQAALQLNYLKNLTEFVANLKKALDKK